MPNRGFISHALMGAAFLGSVWLAIYLPKLLPLLRMGGWPAGLALVAGFLGVLGGPVLLVYLDGDEGFGILGIVAALLGGWACARGLRAFGVAPTTLDLARMWGAALGPLLLFGGFHLLARAAQKKG